MRDRVPQRTVYLGRDWSVMAAPSGVALALTDDLCAALVRVSLTLETVRLDGFEVAPVVGRGRAFSGYRIDVF